jgi:hypothetical protein
MPYKPPKYTPNVSPGDKRRRIWRNENENVLACTPFARMYEEDVVLVEDDDGNLVERSFGNRPPPLTHVPTDPNEVVELRSLVDDTLLGQTTLGMIHTMIHSLGRHMQKLRDIAETARIKAEEVAAATEAARLARVAADNALCDVSRLADFAAALPEGEEKVAAEQAALDAAAAAALLVAEADRLDAVLAALIAS